MFPAVVELELPDEVETTDVEVGDDELAIVGDVVEADDAEEGVPLVVADVDPEAALVEEEATDDAEVPLAEAVLEVAVVDVPLDEVDDVDPAVAPVEDVAAAGVAVVVDDVPVAPGPTSPV